MFVMVSLFLTVSVLNSCANPLDSQTKHKENNWDLVNGLYPASNACGQLGQSYQDYTCSAGEKMMECPLDPTMVAQAKTNAKWYGAPAPLFAGPKSQTGTYTPAWNPYAPCPNGVCSVYPGQQGGAWEPGPAANRAGRTDTENCVWWVSLFATPLHLDFLL